MSIYIRIHAAKLYLPCILYRECSVMGSIRCLGHRGGVRAAHSRQNKGDLLAFDCIRFNKKTCKRAYSQNSKLKLNADYNTTAYRMAA